MKILRVGDPHAKIGNLPEMGKLIDFVLETASKHKVDRIEILGDLFHNHAVIRLEVTDFWTTALHRLSALYTTVVLVGNHDMVGDYNSNISALDLYAKLGNERLIIANVPIRAGSIAYIPYIHDNDKFIEIANSLTDSGSKTIVCHQTFSGSTFENGFYAPSGINPDELRADLIISGHIHKAQKFGKVVYPGTARWDSASDANQPKGIWVYDHDDVTGLIASEEFISTENVCSPILSFTVTEGDDTNPSWPKDARVVLELVGSSAWISQQKESLKGKCSIKARITDKKSKEIRKSGKSLEEYLTNHFNPLIDKDKLLKYAKEIGIV